MSRRKSSTWTWCPWTENMFVAALRLGAAWICGLQIFSLVTERGWKMRELTRTRHSLEDMFVRVTRPELEEEEG